MQIIYRRVRIVVRGPELWESIRGRHLRVLVKEKKPGREQTERRKFLLIQEKSDRTQGTKNRKEQRSEQLYIYKMHEVRNVSRPALADISGGRFFIKRVESEGAVPVKGSIRPLARRALSPSSNKENVPPVGWVAPKRRSPLPDWYPRTPLRDITSIVKAIERRSRLQNAAAQQQILWTEDASQSVDPITPAQAEQGVPTTEGGQAVASLATSLEDGKLKIYSPPSDCSLQATPSKPYDPALADLMEKKLSSSIEQIEKMVRRNLMKTPKAAQPSKRTIQRRTLMSMR